MTHLRGNRIVVLLLVIALVLFVSAILVPIATPTEEASAVPLQQVIKNVRRELVANGFLPSRLSESPYKELITHGDAGFAAVVELLFDDDPAVWVETVYLIDSIYNAGTRDLDSFRRVIGYLRAQPSRILMRYLLPPWYAHAHEWRGYFVLRENEFVYNVDSYWTAEWGSHMTPTSEILADLEAILLSFRLSARVRAELDDRAVSCLFSLWKPQGSEKLDATIRTLLLRVASASSTDPDLRLDVFSRVAIASGDWILHTRATIPTLDQWEQGLDITVYTMDRIRVAPACFRGCTQSSVLSNPSVKKLVEDRDALSVLALVDHPRVYRILVALAQLAAGPGLLSNAIAQGPIVPDCELPSWIPLDDVADRYFEFPGDELATTIRCLAEIKGEMALRQLRELYSQVADKELELLVEAAMVELGDSEHLRQIADAALSNEHGIACDANNPHWLAPFLVAACLQNGDMAMVEAVGKVLRTKPKARLATELAIVVETSFDTIPAATCGNLGVSDCRAEAIGIWLQEVRGSIVWDHRTRKFRLRSSE